MSCHAGAQNLLAIERVWNSECPLSWVLDLQPGQFGIAIGKPMLATFSLLKRFLEPKLSAHSDRIAVLALPPTVGGDLSFP